MRGGSTGPQRLLSRAASHRLVAIPSFRSGTAAETATIAGFEVGLPLRKDAECNRLNVLPQFKRLLKFGVSADFPCIIDTAAEKMGFERRFFITVDPSLKPASRSWS